MTDRFTRLLGIQQPIIQAPMLGVSTPALAAAVSNAGGLGSIAITGSAAEKGRALIREVRGLTDKPFNVNLFCHRPGQADPARERAWLDYLKPLFAREGRLDAAGDLVGLHVEHLVAFLDMRALFLEPGVHPTLGHRQAPLGHGQCMDPAHAASLPSRAWRTAASIFAASGM